MLTCYPSLNEALESLLGTPTKTPTLTPVSGGDINAAFAVDIDHERLFYKRHQARRLPIFQDEAAGLQALGKANLATAEPLALVQDAQHAGLILRWIEPAARAPDFWSHFGEQLAELHLSLTAESFGWQNEQDAHWINYFREHKLLPKFEAAWAQLDAASRRLSDGFLHKLDRNLTPPPRPQLIHGDLWSGNFMVGKKGQAVLIDPHACYGHGEADLAMTQLFGGFDPAFYRAYFAANPSEADYPTRVEIYNLYHLLNHLILFGESYLPACQQIIRRYG